MRLKTLLLTAGLVIFTAGGAHAQTAMIKLTAEDMHTIKEIVLKDMNTPKVAGGDYAIGDHAPAAAELQRFPALIADKVSAVKSHRFFVSGERIFIVDPKDNTIAEIIE